MRIVHPLIPLILLPFGILPASLPVQDRAATAPMLQTEKELEAAFNEFKDLIQSMPKQFDSIAHHRQKRITELNEKRAKAAEGFLRSVGGVYGYSGDRLMAKVKGIDAYNSLSHQRDFLKAQRMLLSLPDATVQSLRAYFLQLEQDRKNWIDNERLMVVLGHLSLDDWKEMNYYRRLLGDQ